MTYLDSDALAERWGCERRTIYDMRYRNDGPPAIRLSRKKLRFRLADVERWEADHLDDGGSRNGRAS